MYPSKIRRGESIAYFRVFTHSLPAPPPIYSPPPPLIFEASSRKQPPQFMTFADIFTLLFAVLSNFFYVLQPATVANTGNPRR